MDNLTGLNSGLGALPLITNARTRSISAENPTGEKGKGGMAVPDPEGQSGRFLDQPKLQIVPAMWNLMWKFQWW